MSREPITDPEILADFGLRARTERDPSRTAQDPTLAWQPAVLVERWACRGKCGASIAVDDAAVHARDKLNEQLRKRGEPEVGAHEIAFCPACKQRGAPLRGEANRRTADAIAALVRELKGLIDNDLRERSVLARLRELGHPDVDGLAKAIADGRAAKNTTKPRRSI